MSYYEEIDPLGEQLENQCQYCLTPCSGSYCSEYCKKSDIY